VTEKKTRATFIRHGQSRANVGRWDGEFSQVPLTELGLEQAQTLADSWEFTPDRIIVSPYVRTEQTAAPTIARFPEVLVERWPIQEFTYWDRAYWGGTTPEDDREEVARFWRICDPEHRYAAVEGSGTAESFSDMLLRAETALLRMSEFPPGERILLFTHGHFMQAMRFVLKFPEWGPKEKMENFRSYDEQFKVKNCELMEAVLEDEKWRLV
jgi:broad specificity phosphatase PhoE